MDITNKKFWVLWATKIFEMMVSAKLIIFFTIFFTSVDLLAAGLIDGVTWGTVVGGLATAILALRQVYKVQRIRSTSKEESDDKLIETGLEN